MPCFFPMDGQAHHAVAGRLSRGPETFVLIKVEDDLKARTKATRTDRWADEHHAIEIDKGNEVELTVYDKTGNDAARPIGMLWIRISDINEEMRRKKIETEINNSGWISADKAMQNGQQQRPDMQFQPPPGSMQNHAPGNVMQPPFQGAPQPQHGPVEIDDWFSLEPVGKIHLVMSFGMCAPGRLDGVPQANMEQKSRSAMIG